MQIAISIVSNTETSTLSLQRRVDVLLLYTFLYGFSVCTKLTHNMISQNDTFCSSLCSLYITTGQIEGNVGEGHSASIFRRGMAFPQVRWPWWVGVWNAPYPQIHTGFHQLMYTTVQKRGHPV